MLHSRLLIYIIALLTSLSTVQASDSLINKFKTELEKELNVFNRAIVASGAIVRIESSISYKSTNDGEITDIGTNLKIEFRMSFSSDSINLFGLLSRIPNLRKLELNLKNGRNKKIPYYPGWEKILDEIEVLKIEHESSIPQCWYHKKGNYTELYLSNIKELIQDSSLIEPKGWSIIDDKLLFRESIPSCFQKLKVKYHKQLDSIDFKEIPFVMEMEISIGSYERQVDLNTFISKFPYIGKLKIKGSWSHRDSTDILLPIHQKSIPLLYHLDLYFSQFQFPNWIREFKDLRILDLSEFDGGTADWSVFNSFKKLNILTFRDEWNYFMLDSLGEEVGNITSLKYLDLNSTFIEQLPQSVILHDSLSYINIDYSLINKEELVDEYPEIEKKLLGKPREIDRSKSDYSFLPSAGFHGSSLNGVNFNLGAMLLLPRSSSKYLSLFSYSDKHSINYTVGFGAKGLKQTLGYSNFDIGFLVPGGYTIKAVYFTPYDNDREPSWGTEFSFMHIFTYSVGYLFKENRCYFEFGLYF